MARILQRRQENSQVRISEVGQVPGLPIAADAVATINNKLRFNSFEDLQKHCEIDPRMLERRAESLADTADRYFMKAASAEKEGDEELAFSYYRLCAALMSHAMKNDERCCRNPCYDLALEASIENSGVLEFRLRSRYAQLQLEPQKENEEEDDDIKKCPICVNILSGKILQCREGHIVCESCLVKIQEEAQRTDTLPKCPYCKCLLDQAWIRNRVLEKQLDRQTFNCCHQENGCPVKMKRDAISTHESSCLYGQSIGICGVLGIPACGFKLSVATAKTVFEHIRSSHPSVKFLGQRYSVTWNLKDAWDEVSRCASPHANKKDIFIMEVPQSQEYALVIAKLTKESVSFHSVDLSLGFSETNKARVFFSIGTKNLLQWIIPVASGLQSWKFLSDEQEGDQNTLGIEIKSLLRHCDDNGRLQMVANVIKRPSN